LGLLNASPDTFSAMSVSPVTTWVVIAAYCEEPVIARVVAQLKERGYQVVVVDDGSSDRTGELAGAAGAVVLRHPINLGQGAGLQTGIVFALAQGAECVVTFDGDGQHRSQEVATLVAALDGTDFALGSRFLGSGLRVPAVRRMLLRLATWFTRLTTGLQVTDTHNGLRAMSRRGASAIALRQNRMAHASEILHQIAESGLKYVEVPVTIDYTAYSLSKGQTLADALLILTDLFARRLQR
jgi:glycosyltransferase involved in cell wall biosynthesis